MSQPNWKLLANIGDSSPLDYGGLFVYEDTTGIYPAEMEKVELIDEDCEEGEEVYEVRRCVLDKCTYANGILSNNQFHPRHPAWFAKPEYMRKERPQDSTYLANVASNIGTTTDDLIAALCGDDILARAQAYRAIYDYHGWDNADSYPLKLTRGEAEERYASELAS